MCGFGAVWQVVMTFVFAIPVLECILRWVAQLTDGGAHALTEFDIEAVRPSCGLRKNTWMISSRVQVFVRTSRFQLDGLMAPIEGDHATQVDDARTQTLGAHPGQGDTKDGAGRDSHRRQNAVVILDSGPVLEALQIALGDAPRVVTGLNDIIDILRLGPSRNESAGGRDDECRDKRSGGAPAGLKTGR